MSLDDMITRRNTELFAALLFVLIGVIGLFVVEVNSDIAPKVITMGATAFCFFKAGQLLSDYRKDRAAVEMIFQLHEQFPNMKTVDVALKVTEHDEADQSDQGEQATTDQVQDDVSGESGRDSKEV